MTTIVDRPSEPLDAAVESLPRPTISRWVFAGAAIAVATGVALRFLLRSHLWLDEALTVDIARLPIARIPGALRHDGAPPLYYALLHGWMQLFGTGDVAVRAFSGLASVAALPLVYLAGRRLGGRRVALAALVVMATSPFAIHYATETRMYALVALLTLAGFLALANALERPTLGRLSAVAVTTALLLYTHYWSVYLIIAVAGWLLWNALRDRDPVVGRRPATRVLLAMVVGGIAFLPWLPTFLYQSAHTGTPWSRPADFGALVTVIDEFAGGGSEEARVLALLLFGLAALGLFGRPMDDHHVVLDLRTRPRARALAAIFVGTPAVAITVGMVTHTAFVARYTSVVFPVFCLLAALGVSAFASRRAAVAVLAVTAALGLGLGITNALTPRTEAGDLAAALRKNVTPGDVVAYCPDQLAPAIARLLPDGLAGATQITYPRGTPPGRIDWVDYGDAVRAAPVTAFAERLDQQAGPGHRVWLVMGRGYRPFNGRCSQLAATLESLRGSDHTQQVVRARPIHYFEHAALLRFG